MKACVPIPYSTTQKLDVICAAVSNTDVRQHGINPFLTGVTVGILVFILGFLIVFAYLVVSYLRYTDG